MLLSEKFLLKSNVDEEKQILEHVKHLLVLSNSIVKPHNVLLGHYYRHMYQMLRLVERAYFFAEDEQTQFEYYVNQIHEMDSFIGELVNMLERRQEETVLVMYGDHLPTFSFTNDTMKNADIYQTEYFIWSNFDMEKIDMNLQAYQLSAAVFERLGISQGYIMKFHQTKHEDEDYLKKLKILEYDILYGDKQIYNGEVPYVATDLKMGIEDITRYIPGIISFLWYSEFGI